MVTTAANKDRPLTIKQELFVRELLVDFNITRAYRRAYPGCHSDKAASCQGCRAIADHRVQAAFRRELAKLRSAPEMTPDNIKRRCWEEANSPGPQRAAVVKAIELAARLEGILTSDRGPLAVNIRNTNTVQVNGQSTAPAPWSWGLTDQELKAMPTPLLEQLSEWLDAFRSGQLPKALPAPEPVTVESVPVPEGRRTSGDTWPAATSWVEATLAPPGPAPGRAGSHAAQGVRRAPLTPPPPSS